MLGGWRRGEAAGLRRGAWSNGSCPAVDGHIWAVAQIAEALLYLSHIPATSQMRRLSLKEIIALSCRGHSAFHLSGLDMICWLAAVYLISFKVFQNLRHTPPGRDTESRKRVSWRMLIGGGWGGGEGSRRSCNTCTFPHEALGRDSYTAETNSSPSFSLAVSLFRGRKWIRFAKKPKAQIPPISSLCSTLWSRIDWLTPPGHLCGGWARGWNRKKEMKCF